MNLLIPPGEKIVNGASQRNNWFFFILILIVLLWAASKNYITLDSLKQMRFALKNYVNHHYAFSAIMFTLAYILAAACSLPIATLLTLTGGFLFGTWQGFIFSSFAATAGATIAFLVIRALWTKAQGWFTSDRVIEIKEEIVRSGFWYLLALRLFALLPFFLVTLLAALSPIRLQDFVAATAIGIMPACLLYSYAGSQLAHINSLHDILTPSIIILFIIFGVLALVPAVFRGRMIFYRK